MLDSILRAYEKRLTADRVIPPKLKEYPSPIQEKVNLVKNHALIKDTQTMLEGPPPYSAKRIPMSEPALETIPEVSEAGTKKGSPELEQVSQGVEAIPPLQKENAEEL